MTGWAASRHCFVPSSVFWAGPETQRCDSSWAMLSRDVGRGVCVLTARLSQNILRYREFSCVNFTVFVQCQRQFRVDSVGLASFSCSKWMIKYQEIPFYFFSFPSWAKAPFSWPASVSWSLQGRFTSLFTLVWALVRLWWAPWGWCEHSEARCFPFPSLRACCWGRKGLFTFVYLFHIQPGETSHFLTIVCLFCTITSGIRRKKFQNLLSWWGRSSLNPG